MWAMLQGGGVWKEHLIEGGSVVPPAKGQLAIRTLNLIKATAISIDLIWARGLNMQWQKRESFSYGPLFSVVCGRRVN